MRRRSFLSAAVGLVLAPFGLGGRRAEGVTEVDAEWWVLQGDVRPGEVAFIPVGEIRYSCDGGQWQLKSGPLPLRLESNVTFELVGGRPVVLIDHLGG